MDHEDEERRFDIGILKTPPTREQVADYIREILVELIPMAKAAGVSPAFAHQLERAKRETERLLEQFAMTRSAPKKP